MQIKHAVVKGFDGKVNFKVFREGGKEHYNIGIWIDGTPRELDSINYVEYILHPSFRDRVRKSRNRSSSFSINIWTWGMFEIDVKIHKKNGDVDELKHDLQYSLPEDEEDNYNLV